MRLFRPSILLALAAVVLVVLGSLWWSGDDLKRPTPVAVREGEAEVAWIAPASSISNWERFVAATRLCRDRLHEEFPGLAVEDREAFPLQSTAVPEIGLSWPSPAEGGRPRRIVFRWYKLTSNWSVAAWIEALTQRQPPPVVVLGGNNSYWARELAVQLRKQTKHIEEVNRPLLLLTTATADRVELPPELRRDSTEDLVPLGDLYRKRTFRFCFTNEQMAMAVSRFIWSRGDLRPDHDDYSTVQWEDDAYSRNLVEGFHTASVFEVQRQSTEASLLRVWTSNIGRFALPMFPPLLSGLRTTEHETVTQPPLPLPVLVESSISTFTAPNVYETDAVKALLDKPPPDNSRSGGRPERRLIVVAGQTVPMRRLLHHLAQSDPALAHHYVIATGDGLSFNTVYRDRLVAWPIQDLPFSLVFFSHYNPIDTSAGFVPIGPMQAASGQSDPSSAGTEDLLLGAQVVEALVRAWPAGTPDPRGVPEGLSYGLGRLRWTQQGLVLGHDHDPHSIRLFRPDGTRESGTGEHIVYLRPETQGSRVLPRATLQVWAWEASAKSTDMDTVPLRGPRPRSWRLVGDTPLVVLYYEPRTRGGA
jgi:hypothetical protein